jgi:flagellar hook-associated protein 3 FlgL
MTPLGSSTARFFDLSGRRMSALSAEAERLTTQISTNSRLASASDAAAAWQRVRGLARDGADAGAWAANLETAQGVLAAGDTALTAVADRIARASELALQARNGTLNDQDREAIAAELAGIVESLAGLANGKDPRGMPLFGGADGGAGATKTAGGWQLAQTPAAAIPTGEGEAVQASESAGRVFALPGGGNVLDRLTTLAAALAAGGDTAAVLDGAIGDLGASTSQVASVQASLGARAARVELDVTRLKDAAVDRKAAQAALEEPDVAAVVTELQKTMTILQATQASVTKLTSLSLFDYLR